MKLNDLVPKNSEYMTKEDTTPEGRVLTVGGFKRVTLRGETGDEQRVVLVFEEDVRPLVLNRTNVELLQLATGSDTTEGARGKQIIVYRDDTIMFGGRRVGGLRIRTAPKRSEFAASVGPATYDDDAPL